MDDPELKALAESLPSIVLRSKAPATVKKYAGGFGRWKKWADSKHNIDVFPAKPFQLSLYLAFLTQTANTSAPIEEAVNSLSWAHQMAVVEDPTDHPLIKQVLAGAKRILAHKTTKKEPITPDILCRMYAKFVTPTTELPTIRTMAICLLGYAGFLRFSELASLRECDVTFYEGHMEIFVESSKTDQFREGAWVPIARTNSDICPVSMLERYFHLGNIQGNTDKLLFRGLTSTKHGYRLHPSGGLSYTRVWELVLEKLEELGLDPKQFGLHSLRSGGASAAANSGVPDRWFKRHGRWRSENAKDGYVKDKLEDRLSVTKNLGL
ncbi:MAG: hypothetical protein MJE68_29245 [Proteobacteria bacterium]|nr:hypothetical protein [Pseudomonadota bacterium]